MMDVKETMAENAADPPQNVLPSEEKTETDESCRPRFQWFCTSGSSKVAAVRPMPRNGNSDTGGRHASPSPSPSSAGQARQLVRSFSFAAGRSPVRLLIRLRQTQQINATRLQPFSFDERDSMQRAFREKKLEEQRHTEEKELKLAATFRANPVRKYKPLVLKESTRPLTVPQAPFSRQDGN